MWKRLLAKHEITIPNLVLAQAVIDKIALAATRFVEDETGEALVGVVSSGDESGVPTIYVLDTIAPDDSAIREAHMFQQGDEIQAEMMFWYHQNWDKQRQDKHTSSMMKRFDLPLRHLGDWHRQPGHMIAPSGGDLMTALDMLEDPDLGLDFLLAPIVTLFHPATTGAGAGVNYLTVDQDGGSLLRIDFWYIERESRCFLPISPTIYPPDNLPELAPYPWHLVNEDRLGTEIAQLNGDGLFTSVLTWDADGKFPLEVCIMMGRQGASQVFIMVTAYDYPASAPVAYLAPFLSLGADEVMYDMLKRMWQDARKVENPPGWKWNPDTYLIDYVQALEAHLGIAPEPVDDAPGDVTQEEVITAETSEGGDDVAAS